MTLPQENNKSFLWKKNSPEVDSYNKQHYEKIKEKETEIHYQKYFPGEPVISF